MWIELPWSYLCSRLLLSVVRTLVLILDMFNFTVDFLGNMM